MKVVKADLAKLKELHEAGKLCGVFETTSDDYHNAPGVSSTSLDRVLISPATFKHFQENPEPVSEAKDEGRILHTLILEPEKFDTEYAVAPPELTRRDARSKEWIRVCEENKGKTVLKHSEVLEAKQMAEVARAHSRAALLNGLKELSFFWKDPTTGILCKCRPDNLTAKGVIVDYKSTQKAFPKEVWAKSMAVYGYHTQGAFYLDGVIHALEQSGTVLEGYPSPIAFVYYAQEKSAPYLVKPWLLGEASIELGRRQYQAALAKVVECEKTGVWPGYPEQLDKVECPEWAWKRELEDVA